jgi:hypothetical protein
MFAKTKVALAALAVLGSATIAFAEDSSSAFTGRLNAMTERYWGATHALDPRAVALQHRHFRDHPARHGR